MVSRIVSVPAWLYQQFDADLTREVPGESYGGWKSEPIEIDLSKTALVVMHAWDTGTSEEFPGWYRAVEYLPRAQEILRTVFPPLLEAVRDCGMHVFHVVGGGEYYHDFPGYRRAVELAGPGSEPPAIESDPALDRLRALRSARVFVGAHNEADVSRGREAKGFPPEAIPEDTEGIAENERQLFALCADGGVNHLVYAGFAINWCLLMSPGGMIDMSRRGIMCSAIREAVTAVENKESARSEGHKEEALWRVALAFGFVFDVASFLESIERA